MKNVMTAIYLGLIVMIGISYLDYLVFNNYLWLNNWVCHRYFYMLLGCFLILIHTFIIYRLEQQIGPKRHDGHGGWNFINLYFKD